MAADAAVKTGGVKLVEIRPAIGLGGKSYATMLGNVSAVESAIKAGRKGRTRRHAGKKRSYPFH